MKRLYKIYRARKAMALRKLKYSNIGVYNVLTLVLVSIMVYGTLAGANELMEGINSENLVKTLIIMVATLLTFIEIVTIIIYGTNTDQEYYAPTTVYPELEPIDEIQGVLDNEVQNYIWARDKFNKLERKKGYFGKRLTDSELEELNVNKEIVELLEPIYEINRRLYKVNGMGVLESNEPWHLIGNIKSYKDLRSRRQHFLIIIHLFNTPEMKQRLAGLKVMSIRLDSLMEGSKETREEFIEPFRKVHQELYSLNNPEVYKRYVKTLGLDENEIPEYTERVNHTRLTTEEVMQLSIQKRG